MKKCFVSPFYICGAKKSDFGMSLVLVSPICIGTLVTYLLHWAYHGRNLKVTKFAEEHIVQMP
jgi:hypothetical protein